MVLSSATDTSAGTQAPSEGASVPNAAAESQPSTQTNEQKPRIDFNVSQEEVDNHRKKMELESKQ